MKKLMLHAGIAVMLTFAISGLQSCKKKCYDRNNPECENYNPCFGVARPTADFKIRQWSHWGTEEYPNPPEFCDTILGSDAKFIANYAEGSSYSWKVGTDIRIFTGKEFAIGFIDYLQDTNNRQSRYSNFYKPIDVTLTVKTKPGVQNKIGNCSPLSDTLISVTRKLVFAKTNPFDTGGIFKGTFQGETQEKVVEIKNFFDKKYQKGFYHFIGFPNVGDLDTLQMLAGRTGGELYSFKNIWWNHGPRYTSGTTFYVDLSGIYKGKIFCEWQPDGKRFLRMEYTSISKDLKTEKSYVFIGKEI